MAFNIAELALFAQMYMRSMGESWLHNVIYTVEDRNMWLPDEGLRYYTLSEDPKNPLVPSPKSLEINIDLLDVRDIRPHYHLKNDSVLFVYMPQWQDNEQSEMCTGFVGENEVFTPVWCNNLMSGIFIPIPRGMVHGFRALEGVPFYLVVFTSPAFDEEDTHYV